ncbi:MAG: hypothetical protein LC130_16625 [Bryobacterales bacterium]|nr:hypothetical protein [Bryobacterales bacterium]
MVIFVHSLGSLWQENVLPAGGVRIWNTTGIRDGRRVRPCAKVFGQVKLGPRARADVGESRSLTGSAWMTNGLVDVHDVRKLALLCRAARRATPDLYLVTVTESLVGPLEQDSFDASRSALMSFSAWRSRQEMMLLMQPFAWLRGSNGSAVLVVDSGKCNWNVTRW